MKRYTFVGYFPCGHVNYLAASPTIVIPQFPDLPPEERLEEWESLVRDLSYYIKYGRVEIVDEEQLKAISIEFCDCKQPSPA